MSLGGAVVWRGAATGPVAFTNGVFDLLHPGHIDLLSAARATAHALIVGINSDESVRRLKGPGRPVRSAVERAYVLAALESVDAVVIFPEDTPLAIIRSLHPDVLIKGGDYAPADVVGRTDVEGWGGRLVIVPLTAGHSTTKTIDSLRDPT
jgi:D-beta-D-heptose 7-phosphate kinase/D-beta-D-heptose 1-phosphate adenosyltransferase